MRGGQLKQEIGIRLGRPRLHRHSAADLLAVEEEPQLGRQKIPPQLGHIRAHPVEFAEHVAPEMLVRVHAAQALVH